MTFTPRWTLLNTVQTSTAAGYLIVATTDVPCHLWAYYTFKQPWVHRTTLVRRGVNYPWFAYWCFVTWYLEEQQEPGDTLTHTFLLTKPVYCDTFWYVLAGDIGGVRSPSESPLFKKHYDYLPPVYLGYSHCPVSAWVNINLWEFRGIAFKATESGIPSTLTVDIAKYGNPGDAIVKWYDVDPTSHIPTTPFYAITIIPDADIPLRPNHAQVTAPAPALAIVKDNWYAWVIEPTNLVLGNGYDLWHSALCLDPPDTGNLSTRAPAWGWAYDDTKDPWFEIPE